MSNIRRLGFTCLSNVKTNDKASSAECQMFNIIFVHGLRGHPQRTWESEIPRISNNEKPPGRQSLFQRMKVKTKAKSPAQNESEPIQSRGEDRKSVHWPSEFLAEDLPQSCVWTYGYDADVIGGLFQANNKNSISQHGRDLAIKLERDVDNECPIIFVAHSLGGIVVKDVRCGNITEPEGYGITNISKALYESIVSRERTKLVVFLGTPHRGSDIAGWGKIAANLVKIGLQDSNKQILRSLEVNSEILERIHRDFVTIVIDKKMRIHSFQESRPMTGVKGFDGKVVSDYSSRLDLPKEIETVETIDTDHIWMTRFGTKEDPGYLAVIGVIRKFCKDFETAKLA